MESDLDKDFKAAFDRITIVKIASITPDSMLKLYAFNKQANFGDQSSSNKESNVRNAFKFNAWLQLKGMSADAAKKGYIELANNVLNIKK